MSFRLTAILLSSAVLLPGPAGANDHATAVGPGASSGSRDAMADGFRDPPDAARPYVWWHWMNGNVTAEGARLDLEWMKRVGIGGVQVFEGNLFTPKIVDKRLVWMSPDWQRALRESVATANRLAIPFGIATSPGWSSTGAPFVTPDAAMKKVVWSETELTGDRRAPVRLPQPPAIAGAFQDVDGGTKLAPFYRDTVVLAFPGTARAAIPAATTSSAGVVNGGLLTDGKFGPTLTLPYDPARPEAWIANDYGRPVTVRSATVGIRADTGFNAPPPPSAVLESSDDGATYRRVTSLAPNAAQSRSVTFAPVTARYFRLRLTSAPTVRQGGPPGVVPLAIGAPPPSAFAVSEWIFRADARVSHAEEKAGFAAAPDYYAIATASSNGSAPIKAVQIIDVTRHMAPDGTLNWTPPPGRWTVLRLGYSLTGHRNGPAPDEATGLEVDKLDAAAVRRYAETYLDRYNAAVGEHRLDALLSDSIEAGAQNWTPGMIADFRRLRGYDPTPWLPVLTGRIVDGAERSDRFLWDFRRTIAELLARNHYATLAAVAKERGLTYYAEALEDHRPQLGDDLAMRSAADVPMGAMWTIAPGGKPRATFVADLQGAASVAHVYGKPLVAAESFTAFGAPWGFAPRDLKATADAEFALGVNRIMIHTSPHQPLVDAKPGMSLAPLLGQYFSRNETWAAMARGWTDYLARSSYLLQLGRPAADIAYFAGEEAPITGLYGETPVLLPSGYGFDFLGAEALTGSVSVASDGMVVTTGGARYALIVLGGSSRFMTLRTLERLRDLVRAGATIAGPAPIASPSLSDDPSVFKAVVDQLWGRGAAASDRVFGDPQSALSAKGWTPDWQFAGPGKTDIAVLKRRLADGALWFVSNRSGGRLSGELSVRLAGYAPELWSADSGTIRPAAYRTEQGRTVVPIELETDGAVFVVLRKRTESKSRPVMSSRSTVLMTLDDRWRISIPAQGTMKAISRTTPLGSWSGAEMPTRYYSGTGTYTRDMTVKRDWKSRGARLVLDLGDVRDVAAIRVNGREAGIAWKPPFAIDVTDIVHDGRNRIEVDVANLWVNRLIADAQPGATRVTVTSGESYTADAPVRPSGLLGPVTLVQTTARER